jgi:hypothetical protein
LGAASARGYTRVRIARSHEPRSADRFAGGRDNGEPGLHADDSPDDYAAFLLDPDGNNVEVVTLAAR